MRKRNAILSAMALSAALGLGAVACDNDSDLEDKIEDTADEIEDKVD